MADGSYGALSVVLESLDGRDGMLGIADDLPHPSGTIAENVMLGSEPTRLGLIRSRELRRRADEMLRDLGLVIDVAEPVVSLDPVARRIVGLAHLVVRAETRGAARVLLDDAQDELIDEDMPRWVHAVRQASQRIPITVSASTLEGWDAAWHPAAVDGSTSPPADRDGAVLSVDRLRVAHPVSDDRVVIADATFCAVAGEVTGIVGTHAHELLASIHGRSYGTVLAGSARCGALDLTVLAAEQAQEAGVVFATDSPLMFDAGAIGGVASQVSAERLRQLARWGLVDANRAYRPSNRVSFLRRVVPAPGTSGAVEEVLRQVLVQGARLVLLPDILSGLSEADRDERIRMLRRIAAADAAVVITGSAEDLTGASDRTYALVRGRIRTMR